MLIVEFDQLQAELKTGVLEQVAMLERLCLADDHWEVAAIASMLEQYGAGLLLAVDDFESLNGGDVPTIKGYCLYQIVFDTAEIHRIATNPSHARQGVAQALITSLMDKMRAVQSNHLLLEVRSDNQPAISLYQKMGFVTIDLRKGYYQLSTGAVDAMIMQWQS